MQEAEVAKEIAEKSYHLFFDAQIFWAAMAALAGVAVNAWSTKEKVKGEKAIAEEEKRHRAIKIATGLLAECNANRSTVIHYSQDLKKVERLFDSNYTPSFSSRYQHNFYEAVFSDIGVVSAASAEDLMDAHNETEIMFQMVEDISDAIQKWLSDPNQEENAESIQEAQGRLAELLTFWDDAVESLTKDIDRLTAK